MTRLSTVLPAPAKVNFALAVNNRRTDGYHDLETVLQSVSLCDQVEVSLQRRGITCRCENLNGEKNLAYQAARIYLDYYFATTWADKVGVRINIEKKIPLQAGLAGGSSDAAAVLRALNILFPHPLSYQELLGLAKECGSDTAFFLKGGTQWGTGTGNDLTDLPPAPEMALLIVKPVEGINTAEAYRAFDQIGDLGSLDKECWIKMLNEKDINKICLEIKNSLEKPAMAILPQIDLLKQLLLREGCLGALMSGSGSAVFGILRDEHQGNAVAARLASSGFKSSWLVKTINSWDNPLKE